MNFVDEVEVEVESGRGGDGCISFRRERYRPKGGPDGGDGGRGGSVIFVAESGLSTLLDQRYTRIYRAKNGQPGMGSDRYGASAQDVVVRIPVGTVVYDKDSGELLADLDSPDSRCVVAQGGRGGRGNIHFKTSTNRSPRTAEPGEPGQRRVLRLELKLLADVGVVGFPNTGKSTLVSRLSRAKPKIADYPFTTLIPTLGVVSFAEQSFVMADVPGLIEGASAGHGLGHRFLKHVERCRLLIHLITWMPQDPQQGVDAIIERLHILEQEMGRFNSDLLQKPRVVAISKFDLPEVARLVEEIQRRLAKQGVDCVPISAVTGVGLDKLLSRVCQGLAPAKNETQEQPFQP